jgi:site-specific recombinase XerD
LPWTGTVRDRIARERTRRSGALGDIRSDEHGDHWLHRVGNGSKPGKVALPPLARTALDQYLVQRRIPVTPTRWDPKMPLLASLEQDSTTSITGTRLWNVMRRFFDQVADVISAGHPTAAEKLGRASPHWMRHTHATHALARGAETTTVRDNLRHASIVMGVGIGTPRAACRGRHSQSATPVCPIERNYIFYCPA